MSKFKVSISGSIGVGKTSVLDHFRNKPGYETFKEVIDNDILELFYDNRDNRNISLLNQYHFSCQTVTRDIKSYYSNADVLIYDRPISENSHIFARKNLNETDFTFLVGSQGLYMQMLGFQNYDLSIILDCDLETNLKRITGRGRHCELNTDPSYFKELLEEYKSKYFKEILSQYSDKVVVVDTTNKSKEEVSKEIEDIIERERAFQRR